MLLTRVIPVLLLRGQGLYKTVKFKKPRYVGDPINTVRIFNEKEVDEIILLDIGATREGRSPNFDLIQRIASECFIPLCYGGGIRSIADVKKAHNTGVEKVCINTRAVEDPGFIREASEVVGCQSVVVCIDAKKSFLGKYRVCTNGGRKTSKHSPVDFARRMEDMGAGEILINSIDQDGSMAGYDMDLISDVTSAVGIPVIACGGAGCLNDFAKAVKEGGASAVSAGSFFVFQGKHRGVLITYPEMEVLERLFEENQEASLDSDH